MEQEETSDLPLSFHQLHHGTFVNQLPIIAPTQLPSWEGKGGERRGREGRGGEGKGGERGAR